LAEQVLSSSSTSRRRPSRGRLQPVHRPANAAHPPHSPCQRPAAAAHLAHREPDGARRGSNLEALLGHGCDATMAPGAAFEFGGGSPWSMLLLDVSFGAPPPSEPHFPRPIRPEPPSSYPCSALTEPCTSPAGTANGVGTVANGGAGTARMAGISAAAAAALSGRVDDAFRRFCGPLNSAPAAVHMVWAEIRPLGGLGGARAAPGGPGPIS
jgi:hypothetical protein